MTISQLTKKFSMSLAGNTIVALGDTRNAGNVVFENENVLNDNRNGEDRDPDSNDTLVLTEVNGNNSYTGQEITRQSGSLLTLNSDGTYSYNPNGEYDSIEVLLWMQVL